MELSSTESSLHAYVREEQWKLLIKLFCGKVSETECAIILRRFPRSSKCAKRNVRSKFRLHSRPGIWWLNRQRRWIWPQLSCYSWYFIRFYLHCIGAERVETVGWSGLPIVSDCTVTVCSSHAKRVSTRSDCTDLDAGFFPDFLGTARC